MNKVLIEICVPALKEQGCFDIFAPTDVPIKDLIGIIASGVAEITNGRYLASGCEHLCLREPCGSLNSTMTLGDYGIKDGTKIYLI
jgi:hypothetical protein